MISYAGKERAVESAEERRREPLVAKRAAVDLGRHVQELSGERLLFLRSVLARAVRNVLDGHERGGSQRRASTASMRWLAITFRTATSPAFAGGLPLRAIRSLRIF